MNARLRQRYREEIVPKLRDEFGYANSHQIPSVSKVVINIGMGEATQNSKLLDKAMEELTLITGQKPALRRAKIQDDGVENITFAWAGGTGYGDVSYFRVQGPSFLIEFDHTQRDPNHIHSGWRDFDGDFGRDVLREHLTMQEH